MGNFIHGFLVCAGLIVSIGAQNAFLLKQGLLRQHVFLVAMTCFICDVILFGVGVLGFGTILSQTPIASVILAFFGAAFLFLYGARTFYSAYKGTSVVNLSEGKQTQSALKAFLFTLAITLLNPHVYLDTVVIIGSIAGTIADMEGKILFLIGACTTSALWFFGVGYGAKLLIPFFHKPITWRILDGITGTIMWLIALGLIKYGVGLL